MGYLSWTQTNYLKRYWQTTLMDSVTACERLQVDEIGVAILKVAYVTSSGLPWALGVYGLFQFKWYMVMLAFAIGFPSSFILTIVLSVAIGKVGQQEMLESRRVATAVGLPIVCVVLFGLLIFGR